MLLVKVKYEGKLDLRGRKIVFFFDGMSNKLYCMEYGYGEGSNGRSFCNNLMIFFREI